MYICTYIHVGFLGGAIVRNLSASAGDTRDACLIPGLGKSHGVGSSNLLQYSCLENSMDRRDWQATVQGITESDSTEHTHTHTRMHARTHTHTRRLQSRVSQSQTRLNTHTHTHTFYFIFFSLMVYHRMLNTIPCAVK